MSPIERNYEIYDKELLAIVEALDKWRQYLLDTVEKFEVWTDHENLKYFREPHKLNGRQARWYLKLQDYDFTLQHIPGKTNTKADILSRREKVDTKEDNQDTQMLKEELWIRRTTNQDGMPIILLRQEHLQVNPNKGTRSNKTVGEKRWTNMGRKRNHLHRWQDLCSKKQTTSR